MKNLVLKMMMCAKKYVPRKKKFYLHQSLKNISPLYKYLDDIHDKRSNTWDIIFL